MLPFWTNLLIRTYALMAVLRREETLFEVEITSGRRVKVLRSNVARYEERGFDWDQPVWLSWHPRSPAVLLS